MELRHLETLATVLAHGTFLGAARALGCSQSTVTLHIQELERELGVRLFAREGKRVRLTAEGAVLERLGRDVLGAVGAMRRAADELRDGDAGEVGLGAIEPIASRQVMPLLAEIMRTRPGLRVRLDIGGTASLARQVAEGALDFAVCSPPQPSARLTFTPLFRLEMALLLPRRHPLARSRRVRARDLAGARILLTDQGCAYREATEAALLARGVSLRCALEIGSIDALSRAVRGGLGVAIVPVQPPPAGLVLRPIADTDIGLAVGIARRDAPAATRVAAALLAQVTARLSIPSKPSSK
jgi:LysR family transcriptional regulator, regulator of the ytmI operon